MGNSISSVSPAPSPSSTPHQTPKLIEFAIKASLAQRTHSNTRRPRILCLDGGGMRGIIEAEFLKEIEKRSGKKVIVLWLPLKQMPNLISYLDWRFI